jgi:hypothetical protein
VLVLEEPGLGERLQPDLEERLQPGLVAAGPRCLPPLAGLAGQAQQLAVLGLVLGLDLAGLGRPAERALWPAVLGQPVVVPERLAVRGQPVAVQLEQPVAGPEQLAVVQLEQLAVVHLGQPVADPEHHQHSVRVHYRFQLPEHSRQQLHPRAYPEYHQEE